MKSDFNTNKWFKNQYLKENNNHVLSPQEWIQQNMPNIDSFQDNYSWDDLSTAMEEYAKYISDWEINNYRQNIER
jgi:hypothetical protein